MDLRESLEIARHVRGCALLSESGVAIGVLGAEGELAVEAGRTLLECVSDLGLEGEACFAASIDVTGAQLIARTFAGYLLVVRTDGAMALSEETCEWLVEALMGTDYESPMDTGVRVRVGHAKQRAS
jgi:hypothetical protein